MTCKAAHDMIDTTSPHHLLMHMVDCGTTYILGTSTLEKGRFQWLPKKTAALHS